MGNDDLDDRSPSFHYLNPHTLRFMFLTMIQPKKDKERVNKMPLYSTFLVIQSAVREKVVENEGLKKS